MNTDAGKISNAILYGILAASIEEQNRIPTNSGYAEELIKVKK